MTESEKFYRNKFPKVKELSLMDKEIIELMEECTKLVISKCGVCSSLSEDWEDNDCDATESDIY